MTQTQQTQWTDGTPQNPSNRRTRRKAREMREAVSPQEQRQRNLSAFWHARYQEARDDHGELARVSFDRARAVAVRAEREGHGLALYELAKLLNEFAEQTERRFSR